MESARPIRAGLVENEGIETIIRTEGGVPTRLGDLILPGSGAVIENEGIDETLPNED